MSRIRQSALVCAASLIVLTLTSVTPSSAAPYRPSSPNCGVTIKKPTGGAWKCTFSEQFSGSALDSTKWVPVTTEATGVNLADCRVNTPETIRVSGGYLHLTVWDTGEPFVCRSANGDYTTQYAAGAVSTGKKFSQAFGRFEIRAAMPNVTVGGLQSSLWMWPQAQRYGSLSGEIDINEWRSNIFDRAVPTVHYTDDGTAGPKTTWDCLIDRPQDFHSYVLEWTRTKLTFIYDGKVCLTHEWQPAAPLIKPQPFDEPYFVVLSQNIGSGYNAFDPAVTPLPATMMVDYVRIWS